MIVQLAYRSDMTVSVCRAHYSGAKSLPADAPTLGPVQDARGEDCEFCNRRKAPWTHKVVKASLGMQGKWFHHPTAATFSNEAEAIEYARQFAADQYAVLGKDSGHRYVVLARKGGTVVKEFRLDREETP